MNWQIPECDQIHKHPQVEMDRFHAINKDPSQPKKIYHNRKRS